MALARRRGRHLVGEQRIREARVKTHKLEMSLWFAAFRILLPDALTQNLRVASDTYTFMSLDPSVEDVLVHCLSPYANSE